MSQASKAWGRWWQGLPSCRGGRWWAIWEGQVRVGVGTESGWPRWGVGEVGREKAQRLALKPRGCLGLVRMHSSSPWSPHAVASGRLRVLTSVTNLLVGRMC